MWRIRGWENFQHFSDRKPPWIKLYRSLLDDLEWHELDPLSAKCLVMMWLIAAEDDGNIPDLKKLAFRLRQSENSTKSIVSKLSHYLIQLDITTISSCHQSDSLETDKETDKEGEVETEVPAWLDPEIWGAFKKQRGKKFSFKAQHIAVKRLTEFRDLGQDPNRILENSIAGGWSGLYAEKPNGAKGNGYISPKDAERKRVIKGLTGYDADAIPGVSTRVD